VLRSYDDALAEEARGPRSAMMPFIEVEFAASGALAARDLRGYRRITLEPGRTRTVAFELAAADRWVVEDTGVQVEVGASSADIRQETTVRVSR
jgi:hypothetical protein